MANIESCTNKGYSRHYSKHLVAAFFCVSMGRKCSVPLCYSNYEKHYVSAFPFPSDPGLRTLWLRNIRRPDFNPGPTSGVCIKHFEDQFIVKHDRGELHDGDEALKNIACIPLCMYRLK
ncbi:hypothetical protein CDAR_470451 [Caerostris darwini]|uniref:THAP-type domain-containing protein n=1 Tax=Caerostris darwini TaxID=1538125 RepID=A0AAV4VHQ1_9ARAC|nr:hypothetical protein CDAR_470451 [Caerostris darwini]